jgi:hypothetical protein
MLSQYCDNFTPQAAIRSAGPSMKVGCGFVEKSVHGQRYLSTWSFESHADGLRKVER